MCFVVGFLLTYIERERERAPVHSEALQMPAMGKADQAKARNQEVNPDFPPEWQGSNLLSITCYLPRCTSGRSWNRKQTQDSNVCQHP